MSLSMVANDRIQSIDILRGLTMVLMIWVNDFWSLDNIPNWLKHMPAQADALGFSDVIFPAFLFIVGLSIPFAVSRRRAKGVSDVEILRHIAGRALALLVMGFFMVNLEYYDDSGALLPKAVWQSLMIVAFILIWNQYPKDPSRQQLWHGLKLAGCCLLAGLAVAFKSSPSNGYTWMEPHWWGILGLIGWSYLIGASAQVLWGRRQRAIALVWFALAFVNVAWFAGWLEWLAPVSQYVWIVGNGALPALTMAGCFVSTLYLRRYAGRENSRFLRTTILIGLLTLIAGSLLRPFWGISKIEATPAWTLICTGIATLSYAFFYWLVDIKGHARWARFLRPAGVATLTCYQMPYLAYPLIDLVGLEFPDLLKTGTLGLIKSLIFALAIVFATGLLNRAGVKLKI